MARLRLIGAIFVGRVVFAASRLRGGGGSALPGLLALRISPNLIETLSAQATEGIVVITGTNGKTTTARMLTLILREAGNTVISNEGGSNLRRGVASALLGAAGFSGRLRADYCVFEVDEASLPRLLTEMEPRLAIVTNLFRDQLDRYGELYSTSDMIGKALHKAKKTVLVLNADDPLVAQLGSKTQSRRYWSIATSAGRLPEDEPMDSIDCPVCGQRLVYRSRSYAHLGDYRCPDGHIGHPAPDLEATSLKTHGLKGTTIVMRPNLSMMLPLPGLYNVSNALGALLGAETLGLNYRSSAESLEEVTAAFGRVEQITIDSRRLYLLLIKNPTGFTQVIDLIRGAAEQQHLLLALNDNFADGTDVSWIWDAAVERLRGADRITVSGLRSEEMLLRLKYAGFDMARVKAESDLGVALTHALRMTPTGETLFVLPTYTALLSLRKLLRDRGHVSHILESVS